VRSRKGHPRRKGPSGRPATFTASLTTPSLYSDVRILDPEAWWTDMAAEVRRQSPLWQRCRHLWAQFGEVQAALLEGLAAKKWSRVPSPQLRQIAYHAFGVHHGIATFLPPDYDDMDPAFRRGLYVHVLLLQALLWVDEGRIPCRDTPHPVWVPARAAFYHMAAPFVSTEITRRRTRHPVSVYAANLLVAMDGSPSGDADHPAVAEAVEELRKRVWWKLPPAMRERKANESPELPSLAITGDIPATLIKEWGSDSLWAYVQALDGKLNIAPQAIAHDIIDAARREVRRSQKETVVPEEILTIRLDHGEERTPTLAPARLEEFLRQAGEDDDLALGLAAALDPRHLEDVAREQGVTLQTIYNRVNRAKARLTELLNDT
jgi:hypothetical protein